MTLKKLLIITALAAAISGCFEGKSFITSDKSNKVAKYLLDSPPAKMDAELNIPLEDKIVLLGYDIDKKKARAGESVTVTWYWKCIKSPGPGWRLMTHVFDHKGTTRLNADARGPIRKHFQPEHWKPGLIIKDIQKLDIPKGWIHKSFELRTGIWKGDKRIKATGKHTDGGGRAKGPEIATTPSVIRRQTRYITKAKTTPEIDGKIEGDSAWDNIPNLEKFLDTMTGFEVEGTTEVKLLWDDENLYVAIAANDNYLKSDFKNHDDSLWKQDAFEIFLDPGGDSKDYYELQVSPAGIIFDSKLPTHRKNQNEWSSKMVAKTIVKGTLNDEDTDEGWTAELSIPFASLMKQDGVPPTLDTSWTANFIRVDKGKDKTNYSAWSPPLRGDFHALDRFGKIVFVVELPKTEKPKRGRGLAPRHGGKLDRKPFDSPKFK